MKMITKPAEGSIFLTSAEKYATIAFSFDPFTADFQREGLDLMILFDDGAQIILCNFFVVTPGGTLPFLRFAEGKYMASADFLKEANSKMDVSCVSAEQMRAAQGGGDLFSAVAAKIFHEKWNVWHQLSIESTADEFTPDFFQEEDQGALHAALKGYEGYAQKDYIENLETTENGGFDVPNLLLVTEEDMQLDQWIFSLGPVGGEFDSLEGQSNEFGSFVRVALPALAEGAVEKKEEYIAFDMTVADQCFYRDIRFTADKAGKEILFEVVDGNTPILYDAMQCPVFMIDNALYNAMEAEEVDAPGGTKRRPEEKGVVSFYDEAPLPEEGLVHVSLPVLGGEKAPGVKIFQAKLELETLLKGVPALEAGVQDEIAVPDTVLSTQGWVSLNVVAGQNARGEERRETLSSQVQGGRTASRSPLVLKALEGGRDYFEVFDLASDSFDLSLLDSMLDDLDVGDALDGGKIDFVSGALSPTVFDGASALRINGATGENGVYDCVLLKGEWKTAETALGYDGEQYHVFTNKNGAFLLLQDGLNAM